MAGDAFNGDALNEVDRQRAARLLPVPLLATRFNVREIIVNIFHVNFDDIPLVFPPQPLSGVRCAYGDSPFLLPSFSHSLKNLLKLRRYEGRVYVNAYNPIERHCHWCNISTYNSCVHGYSWTYDEDAFGHGTYTSRKRKFSFLVSVI